MQKRRESQTHGLSGREPICRTRENKQNLKATVINTVFNPCFMVLVTFFSVNTPTEASSKLLCDVSKCGVGKVSTTGFFQPTPTNNKI